MSSQPPRYYRPYMSDDDEKSEASSMTSDSSSLSDDVVDDMIGSPLSLVRAGGPSMINPVKQIDFRIQPTKKGIQYYPFDLSGEFDPSLPFTGTTFDMNTGIATSILIINSRDRDRNVYPQPTFFTLRVPKIYRNITTFQILQLKLLSSFFYFRPEKENTDISILENGRLIPNQFGTLVPNTIKSFIRTGTYDITSLLSELQTQLNRTPLFFDFPNGISDFIPQFASTGDLGLSFNQPGDTYYDALRRQFVNNPTLAVIVSYYFPSQFAGLSSYTLDQIKYAYYYPVLYECYLDPDYGPPTLNLTLTTSSLLPGETIDQRILYTSQGLNDPVIGELINNNLAKFYNNTTTNILDYYRVRHTFRYSLVNEYLATYQTFNNRISITSSNLNTSLVNLINLQSAKFLAAELQRLGLTTAQYSALQTTVQVNTAVITNMYNFLQSNLAIYFGVDFNTYAPVFFNDLSNSLFIQNGVGATGVDTSYTLAVLQRGTNPITTSQSNYTDTKVYWPNMKNLNGSINGSYNLADASNVPYYIPSKTFGTSRFIDNSNTYVNVDPTTKSGDIVTPIQPGKYTIFRFRSPVRQTLQVETLPLPYYYRFAEYNQTQGGNVGRFFDASYTYVTNTYNQSMSNIGVTDISNVVTTYNQNFSTAYSAAATLPLQVQKSVFYFKFDTPKPTDLSTDSSGYTYTMNVSAVATGSSFGTGTNLFLYHDRGAFMADVSGLRQEIPYHYNKTSIAYADSSMNTIQFRAYAYQTYYAIFRTTNVSFPTTNFRFVTWFQTPNSSNVVYDLSGFNPYANPLTNLSNYTYASQYDSNYIRLPTASNLMGLDPSSDVFNEALPISEPAIGYDASGGILYRGVSSDLTDYKGYLTLTDLSNVPFSQFRKDPITNYTFQKISPYDSNSQTYFYSGSSNAILTPYVNSNYTRGTVNVRQYKLVHWYDYNYIPPQSNETTPAASNLATMTGFTNSVINLAGWNYRANNAIDLDRGVVGFSFLPPEGVWSCESMFFKSAWNGTTSSANDNIKYIGLFRTDTITGLITSNIKLSNAFQVLEFQQKVHYTPSKIASNNNFDARGGTYYKFATSSYLTSNSNTQLIGFTPGSNTLLSNVASIYSMIAFNSSLNVTNMYLLAGSLVPYPEVSDPSGVTNYFGVPSPTGQNMILPKLKTYYNSNFLPSNGNIYQSQYEQSAGIGTQVLHYKSTAPLYLDSSGMKTYTLFQYPKIILNKSTGPSTDWVVNNFNLLGVSSRFLWGYASNQGINSTPGSSPASLQSVFMFIDLTSPIDTRKFSIADGYDQGTAVAGGTTTLNDLTAYWMRSAGLTCLAINDYFSGGFSSNFKLYQYAGNWNAATTIVNLSYAFSNLTPNLGPVKHVMNDAGRWACIFSQVPGNFYDPASAPVQIQTGLSNTPGNVYIARGVNGSNYVLDYGYSYGGGGGYGGGGSSYSQFTLGDGGISITMDVNSNLMYVLPYDQYDTVTAVNTGSNLYVFDITQPANPSSSAVGFAEGTVVYQFVGTPSNFTYVNYYKNGAVLLRTFSNDDIYYISSSNLLSSNSNYSIYAATTTRIAATLRDVSGNALTSINSMVTGPAGEIMLGSAGRNTWGAELIPKPYVSYINAFFYWVDENGNLVNQYAGYGAGPYPADNLTSGSSPVPYGYTAEFEGLVAKQIVAPEYYSSYGLVGPSSTGASYFTAPASNFYFLGNLGTGNDVGDISILSNAWQIFYPNMKINLTKTANSASPITNTTDLTTYPAYSHTSMFFYKNYTKMLTDISGKFAYEKSSNFVTADVSSGYFFYSYINNIELPRSTNFNNNDPNSFNYLAIRGYSPTEKFNCLTRFYLPGRYDFGFITLFDLMQEAQQTVLVDLSGSALVNPSYFNALLLYNNAFKITSNFGNNSVPGFGGSNLTFTGFSNFMIQYRNFYTSGLSNANLLNTITGNVLSNLRAWIQQYLGNILPSYVLQRDNFTQSLTFSILWESALTPQRRALDDDWGLGYNLGYAKVDTPYSTVQRATSFFKILEDFIYLRLNQEFTMNRMDTCSREDLSITHEPTGATNQYAAKLLLAPFGNYATVLVQNPINFNPVLTSLDRLSFQWVDTANVTIDNDECEWNAVVQIQEQVTSPRVGSTIPQPPPKKK